MPFNVLNVGSTPAELGLKANLASLARETPVVVVVVSQFNGTSTPKGPYSAKTGDNDCNVNSTDKSLQSKYCTVCEQFAIGPSLNKMSDKT